MFLFEYDHPVSEVAVPEPPPHRLESFEESDDVPPLREGERPEGRRLDEGEGDVPEEATTGKRNEMR